MSGELVFLDDRLDLLITKAAQRLASAKTAAAVLEAKVLAGAAFDAAKAAARLAKAQGAADEVIGAAHRVEADALEIESAAKGKLAEEYAAAQQAGAVAALGSNQHVAVPSANSLGLDRKDIMDGRRFNKAEKADPGVTRRLLEEQVIRGHEPNRAQLRREVEAVVTRAMNGDTFSEFAPRRKRAGRTIPDPNFDAMAQVAGCCRRLVELVEAHGPQAIRAGFLNEGIRLDTIPLFYAAHAALSQLIEVCDGEAQGHQLQADPGDPHGDEARR